MVEKVRKMIGKVDRFAFRFEFDDEHPLSSLGWGKLTIFIGGSPYWLHDGDALEWTWIDLVEWFAVSWPFLLWELNSPDNFEPFKKKNIFINEEHEQEVYDFSNRHNLALGLKGVFPPALWIFPEEHAVLIERADRSVSISKDEFKSLVEEVVDFVLDNCTGDKTGRVEYAKKMWQQRIEDDDSIVKISTGLTRRELEVLANGDINENVMAAARLSVSLPISSRQQLFSAIQKCGVNKTPVLDKLTSEASIVLAALDENRSIPAFEQGYTMALWLREKLNMDEAQVEPGQLLLDWAVPVIELPNLDSQLDAAAFWGTRGPVIFLNPAGRHVRSSQARRATLAHEIAHLLLDRDRSLPFAEVMGGNTPKRVEQRARAFAAEFLFPRYVAENLLARYDFVEAVKIARSKYHVSNAIIGWQISNSAARITREESKVVQNWIRRGNLA
jgi:Zn-dependent peptidase ImmA (M78 family)